MNVKLSLPYNHRIQHTSTNENFVKGNIRSNTNSLGYNLNFFDTTKAKMFFNRNPSFSKEKRTKPSSQTPKRNLIQNKAKYYSKTNIVTVRNNAHSPVHKKISFKRKNINIKTDSPTFKKFSVYKNNNAKYNTNNNSKTKNVQTFSNRIHKINVYKTTNTTHNNTSSKEKITKRNNQRKITPSKTFQPSLSQQNNLLMNKHKKRFNDDIITADLISAQERKKVILNTVSNSKNSPPGKITKIKTERYNNKGKQLSIDTNQNNIANKGKNKIRISNLARSNNNKNIRTNRINHIQIENSGINQIDTHNNSNSINSYPLSPNNLNSTGMRTCYQFKNRYKNLIETYLLSTSEIDDE